MQKHIDFLSIEDEKEIIKAIDQAELNTSGEIRIHLETHSDLAPLERAQEVFNELKMYETQERNAVLIYIGTENHTFAIIGDIGIHQKVDPDFWDSTKEIILSEFKNNAYKTGLIKGILNVGEKLKAFFPYQSDDINELPNEISRG